MLDVASPLTGHMAVHILAMNVAAPLTILAVRSLMPAHSHGSACQGIATATMVQLVVLWGWHSPPALQFALVSTAGSLAMQLSLLLSALWFWLCVMSAAKASRWRALLALLATGKLFCLLGVLLTFAPRPLYPVIAGKHAHLGAALSDQQLAGLLMLVACPLTYVVAGVVIAALWILENQDNGHALATNDAGKQ